MYNQESYESQELTPVKFAPDPTKLVAVTIPVALISTKFAGVDVLIFSSLDNRSLSQGPA